MSRGRCALRPTVGDTMTGTIMLRVLVAEDNALDRSTLVDLLGALGHLVVAEVSSGTDAVAQARLLVPDAVLLDQHLPEASGVEAAAVIARELPGTAVVLITGDLALQLSPEEVQESAAVALLAKPAPPGTLDATLRMAVARSRALAEARREADEARQALESRKLIERAKGILMRRTGTSEQEAYRIMQRSSQDRSVPMVDIARAVLESEPGNRP